VKEIFRKIKQDADRSRESRIEERKVVFLVFPKPFVKFVAPILKRKEAESRSPKY
jgi:hypothetical protein